MLKLRENSMHEYLFPRKSQFNLRLHTFTDKINDILLNLKFSGQYILYFFEICLQSCLVNASLSFWRITREKSEKDGTERVYITFTVLMRVSFSLLRRLIIRSSNNSAASSSIYEP